MAQPIAPAPGRSGRGNFDLDLYSPATGQGLGAFGSSIGMSRALQFVRRNGVGFLALRAIDRALAATTGSYFARVFLLTAPPTEPALPEGFESRWLTLDELRAARRADVEVDDRSLAEAESGFARCLGVFAGDQLAAYGWFTEDDVPPTHCLGAAIELPPGVAYHYKGFTAQGYRGLGLYPALLADAAARLAAEGIPRLVLAVERSNRASLQSCRRAGCRELGRLRIWGHEAKWAIAAPRQAAALGIRFLPGARWKPRRSQVVSA